MGTVTILTETTQKPITMIGRMSGVCVGADMTDDEKNYKRGWDCITSGHGRTFEFPDVYMELDGYSARVIREWYTHIGGAPTRLQASTRYIDYKAFPFVVPQSVVDAGVLAHTEYNGCMLRIRDSIERLEKMGVPREDIAMLLPLGMTTRVVDKRNLRNLIDMSRQRLCNRAYWEFRVLFHDIMFALKRYSAEWSMLVDTQFMPKCDVTGYCPEKKSCGRRPKR